MFKDKFQYSIAPLTLTNLPIEILHYKISPFLDALSLSRLSQTSKLGYSFFKDPPLKVAYLLKRVRRSDYDVVDLLLEKQSDLLLHKGFVSDCYRAFENITAFQYALWAFDWRMWNIMLYYFQINKQMHMAQQQLEELESTGTPYGRYFDLNPFVTALDQYVRNCDSVWTYGECMQYWEDVIFPLQKKLPMHIAYQRTRGRNLEVEMLSNPFECLATIKKLNEINEANQNMLIELKQILRVPLESRYFDPKSNF